MKKQYAGKGELGKLVVRRRRQAGMSLDDVAQVAQVSASAVYRIESGQHLRPRADTLGRIAGALGLPTADLFAAAGYTTARELPSFPLYLKTRYSQLPRAARQEVERCFYAVAGRHGLTGHEQPNKGGRR